jgi:hypothetical protein
LLVERVSNRTEPVSLLTHLKDPPNDGGFGLIDRSLDVVLRANVVVTRFRQLAASHQPRLQPRMTRVGDVPFIRRIVVMKVSAVGCSVCAYLFNVTGSAAFALSLSMVRRYVPAGQRPSGDRK